MESNPSIATIVQQHSVKGLEFCLKCGLWPKGYDARYCGRSILSTHDNINSKLIRQNICKTDYRFGLFSVDCTWRRAIPEVGFALVAIKPII